MFVFKKIILRKICFKKYRSLITRGPGHLPTELDSQKPKIRPYPGTASTCLFIVLEKLLYESRNKDKELEIGPLSRQVYGGIIMRILWEIEAYNCSRHLPMVA
jgi:hypothetical protein